MADNEIRHFVGVELRADAEQKKIAGYAARFHSPSVEMFFFKEEIAPGAFTRTLKESPDVRALFDHDASKVLGRTKAGTLILREDDKGLFFEVEPPNTSVGNDVMESVKRGDIDAMSFGFRVRQDKWSIRDGKDFRTLVDVDLLEVSVVAFPAYPATSAFMRSMRSAEDIYQSRPKAEELCGQARQDGRTESFKKRIAWYERML